MLRRVQTSAAAQNTLSIPEKCGRKAQRNTWSRHIFFRSATLCHPLVSSTHLQHTRSQHNAQYVNGLNPKVLAEVRPGPRTCGHNGHSDRRLGNKLATHAMLRHAGCALYIFSCTKDTILWTATKLRQSLVYRSGRSSCLAYHSSSGPSLSGRPLLRHSWRRARQQDQAADPDRHLNLPDSTFCRQLLASRCSRLTWASGSSGSGCHHDDRVCGPPRQAAAASDDVHAGPGAGAGAGVADDGHGAGAQHVALQRHHPRDELQQVRLLAP